MSGCLTKKVFNKKPDNQEVTENIANKEIVHITPDDSTFITFSILILGVMFFCFWLKYIPMLYTKLKSLTKKNK